MAKQPGTAIANIQSQLKQEAAELQSRIKQPGGTMIKLSKKKTFVLPDGQESPGPMKVVILDFVSRNMYYDTKYNEKDPKPPACFAIGKDLATLAPSKNAPKKQNVTCDGCPQNEWPETKGEPKPCKNTRLLAVMQPNAKGDDPILLLQVSPTALKSFDGYVATVSKMFGVPPVGVVTEVSFDPVSEYQSLRFAKPTKNDNIEYHWSRRADAQAILEAEPDLSKAQAGGKRGRTLR